MCVELPWMDLSSDERSLPGVMMINSDQGVRVVSAVGASGPPFELNIDEVGSGAYNISTACLAANVQSGCAELQVQLRSSPYCSISLSELD